MNEKNIVAIIPARGGSKGIPKKNLIDFCGKPLLVWSIIQAQKSSHIKKIYVSSDSDEILECAEKYNAVGIKRPDDIAGDTASSESAIIHACEQIGNHADTIVFLQPTSPLRKPDDITKAIEEFFSGNYDSLFSACELHDFLIWEKDNEGELRSFNYNYQNRTRRQDRSSQYVENGSLYIFKKEVINKYNNRIGGKIGMFLMDFYQSFEIDNKDDIDLLTTIFKAKLIKYFLE
ncbi:MAG: acylneuraminate cytidylyltransferase [Deltaproteobacteria bacterium HGW-Deltaproteobacteria-10]|nr:MAG: acylneuraminate cytidylyltransferase [Deltaproteobacteria bacterium HGW-Deltaproteobacteria-10]